MSAMVVAGSPQVTLGNAAVDHDVELVVRSELDDGDGRPLRSVSIDLNGDGVPEKVVPNEFLCGQGGCPWVVYEQVSRKVIGRLFGSSIEVLDRTTNGFRVLKSTYSMGGAKLETFVYEFSNGQYRKTTR